MYPQSASPAPPKARATNIFMGPAGLRCGWRVVLFLISLVLLSAIAGIVSHAVSRWLDRDGLRFFQTAISAAAAFCGTWLMSLIDRRPVTAYGLGAVNRWRNLFSGMIAGFVALSILMGLLRLTGGYSFAAGDVAGSAVWKWAAYWSVFFIAVGLMEEMVTRGYPLFALARCMGFWPSAILLALVFGLGHLGNRGEEAMGIVNAVIAGLVFAFSLRWTGTLWWAIGSHMSWDWAESFFYGVADSGINTPHHFLTGIPAGPAWLSGGTVGPEGSVLAGLVLLLLAAAVRFTAPRYVEPGLDRLPAAPAIPPPVSAPDETPPPALPPSVSP